MGLPRELIDEIMRYSDLRTLKSCSLTSRAFYSAARPLIHRRLVLCSVYSGSRVPRDPTIDQADVPHRITSQQLKNEASYVTVTYESWTSISASENPKRFSS